MRRQKLRERAAAALDGTYRLNVEPRTKEYRFLLACWLDGGVKVSPSLVRKMCEHLEAQQRRALIFCNSYIEMV